MTFRELRESRALTQREVAIQCNVTTVTVGSWEGGKSRPQLPQVRSLAQVFNLTIQEMQAVLNETEQSQ